MFLNNNWILFTFYDFIHESWVYVWYIHTGHCCISMLTYQVSWNRFVLKRSESWILTTLVLLLKPTLKPLSPCWMSFLNPCYWFAYIVYYCSPIFKWFSLMYHHYGLTAILQTVWQNFFLSFIYSITKSCHLYTV